MKLIEKKQLLDELYYARIKHKNVAVRAGVTASANNCASFCNLIIHVIEQLALFPAFL